MALNASLGRLGTTYSQLCSLHASLLPQKIVPCQVSTLVSQFSAFRTLKIHGTLTPYLRTPSYNSRYELTVVSFADASHVKESSHLGYIIGLVVGEVKKVSPLYLLSWSAHRSRRPAKSTPAAEILAASEAVDEVVTLKEFMSKLLGSEVRAVVIVDSKDLCHALSTKLSTAEKSVRRRLNSLRFYFEAAIDMFASACKFRLVHVPSTKIV